MRFPVCAIALIALSAAPSRSTFAQAKYPDLLTVVPTQLNLVNSHGRELLRFSNGIANLGDGPWRMRPEFPLTSFEPQKAIQEILDSRDSSGSVVHAAEVSEFEFHPDHNHWHIGGVALYEFRASISGGLLPIGSADIGAVAVNDRGNAQSIKTTFCLIDWVRYGGNSNNGSSTTRFYWDCFGDYQGISVGWVDQYHHGTPGQLVDVTGLPSGRYYLVSTCNPDANFLELSTANNRAWVAVTLSRDSKGNPKITVRADSYALEGEGVPAIYTTNR
jgi:hypothetical protein